MSQQYNFSWINMYKKTHTQIFPQETICQKISLPEYKQQKTFEKKIT